MASSASARALNSTKANPRGLPVSRSVASERYESGPMAAKCARSSASVTSYGRLPTNRRTAITGFSWVNGAWTCLTRDASRSPGPCGAATQTAACESMASLVRAPSRRAASGRGIVVIQMDEALCYSASTWWCAAGRSSRVLETPATTAMAPRRGAVSHTRDLPPRPAGLTAWFTRFRFIDRQGTASELLALEPGNGGFRRGGFGAFDESKNLWGAGVAGPYEPGLLPNPLPAQKPGEGIIRGGGRPD